MPSLGEAFIEVHADTGPFDRELAASIEKALIKAEATMRSRGRDAGNAFGEGVESAIDDHLKRIGDKMSDSLVKDAERAGKAAAKKLSDTLDDVNFDFSVEIPVDLQTPSDSDLDRERGRLRRWSESVSSSIQGAFGSLNSLLSNISSAGGSISRLGTLFNPAVLISLFGIISGAVLGIAHILNPLGALLFALPGALAGLGAEALVITAAFSGLSDAMADVLGADSLAKALEAAHEFKGGIGNFMVGLAHFGELWRKIVLNTQTYFFQPFNNVLTQLAQTLGSPRILAGMGALAGQLGEFAVALLGVFKSPAFIGFVSKLFPAMARIVDRLTGPFIAFLNDLFLSMQNAIPFLEKLADMLGEGFKKLSQWFGEIAKNGELDDFFTDAIETLKVLGGVAKGAWDLLSVLLSTLRQSGVGDSFLKTIALVLDGLAKFFASPIGQDAIVSMTEAAMGAIVVLGALVIAFTVAWQAMVYIFDAIGAAIYGILLGFQWIGQQFVNTVDWIWDQITALGVKIIGIWDHVTMSLSAGWETFVSYFKDKWDSVVRFVSELGTKIKNGLASFGTLLKDAGKALIDGLIQGIKDAVPGLEGTLNWITSMLPDWKGPESYDKKVLYGAGLQVMQGFRRGIAAGATDVLTDLRDISSMIGVNANTNSFTFGPGAITQNFNGAQPSAAAAQSLGSAVGAGIASAVNNQNMAAAVRAY